MLSCKGNECLKWQHSFVFICLQDAYHNINDTFHNTSVLNHYVSVVDHWQINGKSSQCCHFKLKIVHLEYTWEQDNKLVWVAADLLLCHVLLTKCLKTVEGKNFLANIFIIKTLIFQKIGKCLDYLV